MTSLELFSTFPLVGEKERKESLDGKGSFSVLSFLPLPFELTSSACSSKLSLLDCWFLDGRRTSKALVVRNGCDIQRKKRNERLAQDCLYGEREARNTYVYIERPIERREQRPTFRSPPRSFLENRRPAGGKKYNGAENNQRLKIAKIEAGYGQRDVG